MSSTQMRQLAQKARTASSPLSVLSSKARNQAILRMASQIHKDQKTIILANKKDLARAHKAGLSKAMIGRLELNQKKIKGMVDGLKTIAKLPDPIGRLLEKRRRPNGLVIEKRSVPLGVILIIFESRPNVTADCAGLCVKSGNAVILRGGKEAYESNKAIHASIQKALKSCHIDPASVSFVTNQDRSQVAALLTMNESIDVVIPRGGPSLIRAVAENSTIPVLKHLDGICHIYIDAKANLKIALDIAENAKVQNPGVCNAMETLLVHQKIAAQFLPRLVMRLQKAGVEIRGCAKTQKILPGIKKATEKDWSTEYLDLILSIKIVANLDEAIQHILQFGSKHSDAIVSQDKIIRSRFVAAVDSACVFENASTRFNDGGEFGMGAEMGISTDKLHARGPVGLNELTTYKYIVHGKGQIRL